MSDLQYAAEMTFFALVSAGCLTLLIWALCIAIRKALDTHMQNQKRIANNKARIYQVGRDCYRDIRGLTK